MRKPLFLFSLLVVSAVLLSACGASAATPEAMMTDGTPTAEAMMMNATSTADAMMMHVTPTAEAMMMNATSTADAMMMAETPTADAMMMGATPTTEAMLESPAWLGAALANVKNGENFTIHDFQGKVVLLETMSVACADCQSQQHEIQALNEQLGMPDDLVPVSLDTASNDNADALKTYLAGTTYGWRYAVAPESVAQEFASLYGNQFVVLIIDRHGEVHALPTVLHKADDLLQAVNMYLK